MAKPSKRLADRPIPLGRNDYEVNFDVYQDKVLGCINGKNIGGTLGAPFECHRGVFDAEFYTQPLNGKPLPNDDLDMQILWLVAAERYGSQVSADVLGEYWLAYVIPNWSEYGAAKNNLRMGIAPPLSGYVGNTHKDSNGSWIFSELWACLAPGHPEIAVKYAREEAKVAHAGEGVYSAVFCAAVQSAAFVESDPYRLIETGLSYIPADCGTAQAIRCVIAAYQSQKTWQEARRELIRDFGGTFGLIQTSAGELPEEERTKRLGYDAPSGVGMVIIGWLYGEGDFGKSICIAANCGDDADCTAGTLAATLGIIRGNSGLDSRWLEPLGGFIETMCIDKTTYEFAVPRTTKEMADRIVRLAPVFLGSSNCDVTAEGKGYGIHTRKDLQWNETRRTPFGEYIPQSKEYLPGYQTVHNFLLDVELEYDGEPYVYENESVTFRVHLQNNLINHAQWLEINWLVPEGWAVLPGAQTTLQMSSAQFGAGQTLTFELKPSVLKGTRHNIVLQIISNGHYMQTLIPVVLLSGYKEKPFTDEEEKG